MEREMPEIHWSQRIDFLVAIFFLCIIVMMVIPLPPLLIDILLTANIMLSIVILLTVLYIRKTLEFSIFPSILLMATVFRLALEVSTSRLILLGRGGEIGTVKTFGSFVIGGIGGENYIVGIIIFIILTIIQLIVIVRGTTRVSEVAARFTLDSMPGKQMAIDADLNAGYITQEEAIKRRQEIRQEADFYGAMDGAAKFVQGDVIAAIVIVIINIIGGLIIGVIVRDEPLGDAARAYTTYTIGAGLCAQIPAFLISTATGILVSRSGMEFSFRSDIIRQITSHAPVLWITGGALLFLLLTPLPKLPLLIFACVSIGLGYIMKTEEKKKKEMEEMLKKKEEIERIKRPEAIKSLLLIDPIEFEIGYSLIPFIDPEQGGDFLERITMIRRQIALEQGIIVPPIRVRDNIQLPKDVYIIKIKGIEVARGSVKPEYFLAMGEGDLEQLPGEETRDPTFNLPCKWIKKEDKELASKLGFTVVDSPSVMATHLTEIIKKYAADLLGREETKALIENIKEKYPTLVEELIPEKLSIGELQKVLHGLLNERVSIRDMVTILEALSDWVGKTKEIGFLIEKVRERLSRQITSQYKAPSGELFVITVDPKLEEKIASTIQKIPEGEIATLAPAEINRILKSIEGIISKKLPYQPVFLVSPRIRRCFREIIAPYLPFMGVLSYDEIERETKVSSIGIIS